VSIAVPGGGSSAVNRRAGRCYAQRAALEGTGSSIGPLDTPIASHTLAVGATLITHNESEFRRVVNLRVQNWLG
jgi:predicted nucleic acid-binding protein